MRVNTITDSCSVLLIEEYAGGNDFHYRALILLNKEIPALNERPYKETFQAIFPEFQEKNFKVYGARGEEEFP